MEILRWTLLAVGLLLIAFLYWRGRRDARRPGAMPEPERPQDAERVIELGDVDSVLHSGRHEAPGFSSGSARTSPAPAQRMSADQAEQDGDDASAPACSDAGTAEPADGADKNKIIAIKLIASDGRLLSGAEVLNALRVEGLHFGEFGIFHRHLIGGDGTALFSVANLVEPGDLDEATLEQRELPGLTLFAVLPGPARGLDTLDDMMATARRLAASLDAELFDQAGSSMTPQTADHLRESILAFEHELAREHAAGSGPPR